MEEPEKEFFNETKTGTSWLNELCHNTKRDKNQMIPKHPKMLFFWWYNAWGFLRTKMGTFIKWRINWVVMFHSISNHFKASLSLFCHIGTDCVN
jgi:hypothetical protein